MKKMILSAWLMMLSIAALAQSFVVVDKDGNKVTYDVSKLEQITFQNAPPGFTVYEVVEDASEAPEQGQKPEPPTIETTLYTFDEVASFAGDPDFLFSHPDTVYVGADGQDFAFQLRTNVAYDYKIEAGWLQYGGAITGTDSLYFKAAMNPSVKQRMGYIAFASRGAEQIVDTLWVIQRGKKVDKVVPSLMKVVVNMLDRPIGTLFNNQDITTVFYVRTKYNATKDIILTNYINGNEVLSFKEAFVGPDTLSDSALMSSTCLVSSHTDSTSPFFHAETYWHIYAQHGCPMPRFNNPGSLTSSDVGAEWKDQLNRHYKIGLVDSNYVYLVPIMYQDVNGHWTREWKNTVYSDAITSLMWVSGGNYHTTISSISGYTQNQLRPVMSRSGRKWFADGKEITEIGTYYCDEFKVNESAIGYDPQTITDWFGNIGNNVDLTGALPLAEFTFSYNYKGAQCCVNTTLKLVREIMAHSYAPIQQQFFHDNGEYKAMFIIPKAKINGGVEIDKPFNSPASNSQGHVIYRKSSDLKDVNDQVDRQIGYLYNPNTGDYLAGMAAGLSLVSGDTVKEKRNQNIPADGDGFESMCLNFSPSNTNKFYVSALSSALFKDHQYYFQPGLFKELNYYVSYFDPAENVGQVYWYKDGNSYVIYSHCQNQYKNQEIKVPEFMEGLSLSVVEKTSDAELLTDTIQNGKFFVNYNSDAANYIVLKTK